MADHEAKPVYVSIDEDDEPRLLQSAPDEGDFSAVEDGSLVILRFTPFSPGAQEVANRGGKVEYLEASYNEPSDEELEDDPNAEGTWDTDWTELRR